MFLEERSEFHDADANVKLALSLLFLEIIQTPQESKKKKKKSQLYIYCRLKAAEIPNVKTKRNKTKNGGKTAKRNGNLPQS